MSISRPWLLSILVSLFVLGVSPLSAQQATPQPNISPVPAASHLPPPPEDIRIFVNGKDVTGSKNIKLKDVSVRFDADGNLHVDAPRYQLKLQPGVGRRKPKAAVPPPAVLNPGQATPKPSPALDMKPVRIPPTKRYFVSMIGNYPSVLGCRISVLLNGEEVATFNGQENHLFKEITDKVSRGFQDLVLQCRRPPGAQPKSEDIEPKMLRDAFLEIHVGPGEINGPMVELSSIAGKIRCTDRTGGRIETNVKMNVE